MQNATRPNRPDLDATKVPTDRDIAWAAGIYEGEGTCRLCGKGRGFMASVTQKDPEILFRLRDWFGGSVRDNGTGQGIHTWDICGDRARIFMGLIYEFMTARRRTQIDPTGALEFLGDRSPIGMSQQELRAAMDEYYAAHKRMVAQRKKAAARKRYEQYAANPEWKEQDRAKKEAMRSKFTEAERQKNREYAKAYFQRKKVKKKEQLQAGVSNLIAIA